MLERVDFFGMRTAAKICRLLVKKQCRHTERTQVHLFSVAVAVQIRIVSSNEALCEVYCFENLLSPVMFTRSSPGDRSQELVCEHEIRNIHCACQDADDLTHFAYITKDHTSKSHYCHVFCVQTMVRDILATYGFHVL